MIDTSGQISRLQKRILILIADSVLIVLSSFLALSLRLNEPWPIEWVLSSWRFTVLAVVLGLALSVGLRIPSLKLSTFDSVAQMRIGIWVMLITAITITFNTVFSLGAPRTVPVIMGFLLFVFAVGLRFVGISILRQIDFYRFGSKRVSVAIYGAGDGGMQLISSLKKSAEFRPTLLVDDNKSIQGVIMGGLRVCSPNDLKEQMDAKGIKKVFLAMPSISRSRKKLLWSELSKLDCEVMELPSYTELIESGDLLTSLKPVSPDELLGRDGVKIDLPEINNAYAGKNILVSGAGGSIGSELCRKIIDIKPKKLLLFEMSEYALYKIEMELSPIAKGLGVELVPVLGSVVDSKRIHDAIKSNKIEVVLHAAAYKHVPLIEENELEAGRNNILGTKSIAEASLANGVGRFILISTDKAVRPTNVMGASKRFAELIIQDLDKKAKKTIFSIVRFGNVLGSSGSVIPLFKEQIASGGPITLTHLDVTRYFMTIPEAAKLVLLAGSYSEGGEVFVLDMGKPVKIADLARKMIELSGLSVLDKNNSNGDIAIEVTGLRRGEKLYEELLIDADTLTTPHAKIMRAQEASLTPAKLKKAVAEVENCVSQNKNSDIRKVLLKTIDGYIPSKFGV